MGAVPGPFDCFLTQRGIKTLAVRMERHCDNAERVADVLAAHPAVVSVLYPGRADAPGARGGRQADAPLRRDGLGPPRRRRARPRATSAPRPGCSRSAESLGGVESLVEHPGAMTHASTAGSLLEVPADLVRLSVGLEDADDLVDDVRQALDSLSGLTAQPRASP